MIDLRPHPEHPLFDHGAYCDNSRPWLGRVLMFFLVTVVAALANAAHAGAFTP